MKDGSLSYVNLSVFPISSMKVLRWSMLKEILVLASSFVRCRASAHSICNSRVLYFGFYKMLLRNIAAEHLTEVKPFHTNSVLIESRSRNHECWTSNLILLPVCQCTPYFLNSLRLGPRLKFGLWYMACNSVNKLNEFNRLEVKKCIHIPHPSQLRHQKSSLTVSLNSIWINPKLLWI